MSLELSIELSLSKSLGPLTTLANTSITSQPSYAQFRLTSSSLVDHPPHFTPGDTSEGFRRPFPVEIGRRWSIVSDHQCANFTFNIIIYSRLDTTTGDRAYVRWSLQSALKLNEPSIVPRRSMPRIITIWMFITSCSLSN